MLARALPLAALAVLSTACSPRLVVRRDVPPNLELGQDVRAAYVEPIMTESTMNVVLDPLGAIGRTIFLAPEAARRIEAGLTNARLFYVIPNCQAPCPQADTRITVEVTQSGSSPGAAATQSDSGTAAEGRATLTVRALKADGRMIVERQYHGLRRGAVPGSKQTPVAPATLVQNAVLDAADDFVGDLLPRTVRDSFALEDDGPLEPSAKLAANGDLDGAEAALRAYIEQNPGDARALYNLGAVFTAKGQLEAARDAFVAAAQRDGQYADDAARAERRISDRDRLRSGAGAPTH